MFKRKVKFIGLAVILFLTAFLTYQKATATVPGLKEGSYLTGQTFSVWPSWSVLGNAVGEALPIDPINQLGKAGTCAQTPTIFCISDSNCPAIPNTTTPQRCVLHDPDTGWSTADRRFSFACATSSYAYRYINLSTSTYMVRAHFEDVGITINNLHDFVSDFISTTPAADKSYFVIDSPFGICYQDQEISTIQRGVCGDRVVNLNQGEECDPPGYKDYNKSACPAGNVVIKTCSSTCQWGDIQTKPCSEFSKCGNGIIEAGETCDDGKLNGKYNHCNTACSGRSALGYCGDKPVPIVQPKYEICDKGGVDFWAPKKEDSCSWDCQHYGPYCGDGVVEKKTDEIPGALGAPQSNGLFSIRSKMGKTIEVREHDSSPNPSGCHVDKNGGRVSCSVNVWDYTVDFDEPGEYAVKAITSNYSEDLIDPTYVDTVCPAPGVQHHVIVSLDNTVLGDYCVDANSAPQDGQEYVFDVNDAGEHTFSLEWDNDWNLFENGIIIKDSNIKINKIYLSKNKEECDGNQRCQIGGETGERLSGNCKKADFLAGGWWKMDSLNANSTPDSSRYNNTASCSGAACPNIIGNGKIGGALGFNVGKYMTVPHSNSLMPSDGLTLEAWIYPTSYDEEWQRVMEKGGWIYNSGYGFEFNLFAEHKMRLNLWSDSGNDQHPVDSSSTIPLNQWTHVVGTYQKLGGNVSILKMYVNGVFETSQTYTEAVVMKVNSEPLTIGKAGRRDRGNYFRGYLDEVKVYPRALTDDEIKNNYETGWFCSSTIREEVAPPGTCGDGVVGSNEACDRGKSNNGKPCLPAYGKSCSYCSADCQNVIDVQPTEYCGNGIVEGPEYCDTDATGTIYRTCKLKGQNPHEWERCDRIKDPVHLGEPQPSCADEAQEIFTFKKGTKVCANNCSTIKLTTGEKECIKCGLDQKDGVEVGGGILNVLGPSSTNPLWMVVPSYPDPPTCNDVFACPGAVPPTTTSFCQCPETELLKDAKINLYISQPLPPNTRALNDVYITGKAWRGISASKYFLVGIDPQNPRAGRYSDFKGRFNPNPICSAGDAHYILRINSDIDTGGGSIFNDINTHYIDFPIISDPRNAQPWKYDLVLSPVITKSGASDPQANRPKDIRVVVEWVGEAAFYGGWLNPSSPSNPTIEGFNFVDPDGNYYATGKDYYLKVDNHYKQVGIWYHGFGFTAGRTSEESFTVDGGSMEAGAYVFYVRTPHIPIRPFQSSARLKVEVYLPEDDANYRHFARPVKTYYLSSAVPSDHSDAEYWQVFNLLEPSGNIITADDIMDINSIVTAPKDFIPTASCADRAGKICRSAAGPCDQPEYCVAGQDECPPNAFLPDGTQCIINPAEPGIYGRCNAGQCGPS